MQSNHALHFSSSSIHVLLCGLQSLTPCLGRYLSHKRITYQIKKTHTLELGTDERSFGIALCGSAASSRPPNVWYWHSAWRHLTPWPSINSSLCHQTSSFALPVSAQLPLHQATRVTVLFTKQKRPQESSGCHGWLSGKKEKKKKKKQKQTQPFMECLCDGLILGELPLWGKHPSSECSSTAAYHFPELMISSSTTFNHLKRLSWRDVFEMKSWPR